MVLTEIAIVKRVEIAAQGKTSSHLISLIVKVKMAYAKLSLTVSGN
jgi:hypothetical protein